MRYSLIFASALPLATQVLGGSVVKPQQSRRLAEELQTNDLFKRQATCGKDSGKCPDDQCCSEGGYCGSTKDYCKSPACQIEYSNGNCDADEKPCGDSTEDIDRSNDSEVNFGAYIKTCTKDKVVALTFDDGPYQYTTKVLDMLKKYDAKATFFVTGNNIGKNRIDDPDTDWPAILRRTHKDGHQIASHTWSHLDLSEADDERRTSELVYNEMALRNVLGFFPTYMRPPKGTCTIASGCMDRAVELGYHVVTWDLDTKDFENNKPDTIQKSKDLFDAGFDGSKSRIVLSHDSQEQTALELTEYMIKKVQDAGYELVTVGECLGDPEENWYIKAEIDEKCEISENPGSPGDGDGDDDGEDPEASEDGSCGDRSNGKYTCEESSYGKCCSYNGWCGSTSGYCDGGCQKGFGTCNDVGDEPLVSQNGLCGEKSFQTCQGSEYGNCCSVHGNCGSTSAYCGQGCQSEWGTCN